MYVCVHVHLTFMLLLIYKPSQLYNIFEAGEIFIYIILCICKYPVLIQSPVKENPWEVVKER